MKSPLTQIASAVAVLTLAFTAGLWAADAPAAQTNTVESFLATLHFQSGHIEVGKDLAQLNVPETFRFLGPEDAARVLRAWGNPVSEPPLGMLFPATSTPFSSNAWAVVIQWSADGYVKDDDASTINYDKLLKEMQAGSREANKERTKQGYPSVELLGWAAPPRYDAAAHKLYWAKELRFGGESERTLNYNIRMLGRRGVLVLNAVAGTSRLADIESATPQLLAMVSFKSGQRYEDFNPSSDKYAAYGLAALVAGGVAAKTGLLKGLLVALFAAKKFIIIGLIAAGGFIAKLLGRKKAGPTA